MDVFTAACTLVIVGGIGVLVYLAREYFALGHDEPQLPRLDSAAMDAAIERAEQQERREGRLT